MLQSAALRSLLRGASQPSVLLNRSTMLAQRLTRPSSCFSSLAAVYSPRFGANSAFARGLQLQTFASVPSRRDEERFDLNSGNSKKQQIQELLEQNAALKKEVETLKAEVAKKPNKFMGTLQQYGMPFLIWWTSLYLVSGVSIYVALDTGLVSGASIIDFIMQMGLDKFIDPTRLDPTYGNIAIAVIVNECIEIIRFPITLATLPYVKGVFSRKNPDQTK